MERCLLIKRILLLTILLPFIQFIPYELLNFTRTVLYTTVTTLIASYVFLINFPAVIKMSHTRSLTFSDLEDEKYVDPIIRKRFQVIFIITLQVFGALMLAGMIDYYMFRYWETSLSIFEILGVSGGFISLISKIERLVGNALLKCLNNMKTKSTERSTHQSKFQKRVRTLSSSLSGISTRTEHKKNIDNIELENVDNYNNTENNHKIDIPDSPKSQSQSSQSQSQSSQSDEYDLCDINKPSNLP